MDPVGLVERDFSDLGAVAEIATDCDAASPILSNRRTPRCLLGCNFERPQRTGIAGKQFAPQVDRIATSGKSELVDRDSRANSVWELPTERQIIVRRLVSTFVASSLKFWNSYGWLIAPLVVKMSIPF